MAEAEADKDTRATGPAPGGAGPGTRGPSALGRARALVRACRPRQWLKNLLVFAAPATAGGLTDPRVLGWTFAVFVLFCIASSGTYLLNDARDVHRDRRHERKRHRPVASGTVPVPLAVAAGAALVLAAPLLVLPTGNPVLFALLAGYLLLTGAYTLKLKDVVVCDLVAVAGCHVIRALAGGAAVGVPFTSWFLIVVSLAALLVVTGKRESELRTAEAGGTEGAATRDTLARYTADYLAQVRTMASGAMIVTYCLWALEGRAGTDSLFHAASIVPFIMFVLRYNLLAARGAGEEPEEIALRDRPIQLCLLALAVFVGLGIYL